MPSLFSRSRTALPTPAAGGTVVGGGGSVGGSTSIVDEHGVMRPNNPHYHPLTYSATYHGRPSSSSSSHNNANANPDPYIQQHLIAVNSLSFSSQTTLTAGQLSDIVEVVCTELGKRGLTTPFIFRGAGYENAVKGLVNKYLKGVKGAGVTGEEWKEEAKFANEHELGTFLRWALARTAEPGSGWVPEYDPKSTTFEAYVRSSLSHTQRETLLTLLSLFTRLIANSNKSGYTPPTLSPLFAPLIFGLPSHRNGSWRDCYDEYVRLRLAMENLILGFIKWQDGRGVGGVPTKLKDWLHATTPGGVEKGRRMLNVRRNVRHLSPNLARDAVRWRWAGDTNTAPGQQWKYSEGYLSMLPYIPPPLSSSISLASSTSSSTLSTASTTISTTTTVITTPNSLSPSPSISSLNHLKWSQFETAGFSSLPSLNFDLTESARQASLGLSKRQSLSWNDFTQSGFSRTDEPLSTTLQFSKPVLDTVSEITSPPSPSSAKSKKKDKETKEREKEEKKLRKMHKAMGMLGMSLEPVLLNTEEEIDASFLDVFCDYVYGAWGMRVRWALIELVPLHSSSTQPAHLQQPTLYMFEEFSPMDFQLSPTATTSASSVHGSQVDTPTRRRFNSLFTPQYDKDKEKSATLKKYNIQHANPNMNNPSVTSFGARPPIPPPSSSTKQQQFEAVLKERSSATKVIKLGRDIVEASNTTTPTTAGGSAPGGGGAPQLSLNIPQQQQQGPPPKPPKDKDKKKDGNVATSSPIARFKRNRTQHIPEESLDFETKLRRRRRSNVNGDRAGTPESFLYSSDEDDGGEYDTGRRGNGAAGEEDEDAWVDILVSKASRKIDNQAFDPHAGGRQRPQPAGGRRRGGGENEDEEMRKMKSRVEKVLANVPLDDDDASSLNSDRRYTKDSEDIDIEVEMVPRRGRGGDIDALHEHAQALQQQHRHSEDSEREYRLRYDDSSVDDHTVEAEDNDASSVHDELQSKIMQARAAVAMRRAAYTTPGGGIGGTMSSARPVSEAPTIGSIYTDEGEASYEDHTVQPPASQQIRPLPSPPKVNVPLSASDKGAGAGTTLNKTAALIEMYREKEKAASTATTIHAPIPSRIPVAVSSSGAKPLPNPAQKAHVPDLSLEPPRPLDVVDRGNGNANGANGAALGRTESPGRYIHGAPLHNVLEEEEEGVEI